jgi:hypothetical protein
MLLKSKDCVASYASYRWLHLVRLAICPPAVTRVQDRFLLIVHLHAAADSTFHNCIT